MTSSRAKSTPASPSFVDLTTSPSPSTIAMQSQQSANRPLPSRRPTTGSGRVAGALATTIAGSSAARGR